jgi:hypothetical protein
MRTDGHKWSSDGSRQRRRSGRHVMPISDQTAFYWLSRPESPPPESHHLPKMFVCALESSGQANHEPQGKVHTHYRPGEFALSLD